MRTLEDYADELERFEQGGMVGSLAAQAAVLRLLAAEVKVGLWCGRWHVALRPTARGVRDRAAALAEAKEEAAAILGGSNG